MKLLVPKFSQKDPRWGQEKLGTSSVTIADYGCALAVLAMVEKYYGFDTDPFRLNQLLIEKGVYQSRNLMGWWEIGKANEFVKLTEWIDCPTTPAPVDKVDRELAAGRPVIAWVDINPNQPGNQQHFVVIIGKDEAGSYFALDPWYHPEDAIYFHQRYGEPARGILGLRLISGPVPKKEEPSADLVELKAQIEQHNKNRDDLYDTLKPVGLKIEDPFERIIGLIAGLIENSKNLEEIEESLGERDFKKLKEKIEELKKPKLAAPKLTRWQHLILFLKGGE